MELQPKNNKKSYAIINQWSSLISMLEKNYSARTNRTIQANEVVTVAATISKQYSTTFGSFETSQKSKDVVARFNSQHSAFEETNVLHKYLINTIEK